MEQQLFRKKVMDRISSPDRLQDYMRVTNPGVWMILAAVIALLGGLFVLSCIGRIEVTISTEWKVKDGKATAEFPVDQADDVYLDSTVRIDGKEAKIESIGEPDDETCTVTAKIDLKNGTYKGVIVTEEVRPIMFLWNDKRGDD